MTAPAYPQASVLIVDDDPDVRAMVMTLLKLGGYTQVRMKDSARDLLEELASRSYDLILLDWRMPEMSGIAVLEQVRAYSQVPIIMMTMENHRERVQEAIDKGVTDYLVKPFTAPILLKKINKALEQWFRQS